MLTSSLVGAWGQRSNDKRWTLWRVRLTGRWFLTLLMDDRYRFVISQLSFPELDRLVSQLFPQSRLHSQSKSDLVDVLCTLASDELLETIYSYASNRTIGTEGIDSTEPRPSPPNLDLNGTEPAHPQDSMVHVQPETVTGVYTGVLDSERCVVDYG
jgi:hypothetical protein